MENQLAMLVAEMIGTRDTGAKENDMNDEYKYEPTGTARHGNYYWCIKVPETICPRRDIYACADRTEITGGGDLVLRQDGKQGPSVNLAFAKGQWHVVFAASCLDGSAVAVDHWEGEVVR